MLLRILLKASTRLDWLREMMAPVLLTMEAGRLPPWGGEASDMLLVTVFWPRLRTLTPAGAILGEDVTDGKAADLVMLTAVADTLALLSAAMLFWALLAAASMAELASCRVDTGRGLPSLAFCCWDVTLLGLVTTLRPAGGGLEPSTPLEVPPATLGATLVTVLVMLPVGVFTVLIRTLRGREGPAAVAVAFASFGSM